jgi:uncharacterized membrane protein
VTDAATPARVKHSAGAASAPRFSDSLSFIDLLYAVPISDLAVRVSNADLARVPAFEWANLGVCLTVIVLSWIGLHKNRAEMAAANRTPIGDFQFRSARFVQFLVEMTIVGLYFVMGLKIELPKSTDPIPSPSISWVMGSLVLVFLAYFVWDVLDVLQAKRDGNSDWLNPAVRGGCVTLGALLVFTLWYFFFLPSTKFGVITVAVALSVLLLVYRIAEELATEKQIEKIFRKNA